MNRLKLKQTLHIHWQLAGGREEQLPRNKLSQCDKGGVEWTHRV